jgi:hypothetical protein
MYIDKNELPLVTLTILYACIYLNHHDAAHDLMGYAVENVSG